MLFFAKFEKNCEEFDLSPSMRIRNPEVTYSEKIDRLKVNKILLNYAQGLFLIFGQSIPGEDRLDSTLTDP